MRMVHPKVVAVLFLSCVGLVCRIQAEPVVLRQLHETAEPGRATLRIDATTRSDYPVSKYITGKFAEHLGANIYNGMDAQILRNPTFADHPFWNGQMTPDGVTQFYSANEKI